MIFPEEPKLGHLKHAHLAISHALVILGLSDHQISVCTSDNHAHKYSSQSISIQSSTENPGSSMVRRYVAENHVGQWADCRYCEPKCWSLLFMKFVKCVRATFISCHSLAYRYTTALYRFKTATSMRASIDPASSQARAVQGDQLLRVEGKEAKEKSPTSTFWGCCCCCSSCCMSLSKGSSVFLSKPLSRVPRHQTLYTRELICRAKKARFCPHHVKRA